MGNLPYPLEDSTIDTVDGSEIRLNSAVEAW